ncbi:MAG: TetR/AcrR family transcriptional regulator [Brachybacterium sp.]|nr:TetR/AcrR family transcriptional regulator [Brachybacterium sp.]
MPRIVDHAQRRREIVLALWAVIHERGIAGASLRAVAEEAGISIGRIQHYFSSKEELVREGCRAMISWAAEQAGPTRTSPEGLHNPVHVSPEGARRDLEALLLHALPRTEGARLGTSVWYAYLAQSAADPVIARIVSAAQREALHAASSLLSATRGSRDPGNRDEDLATELVSLADGLGQRVALGVVGVEAAESILRARLDAATRSAT